MHDLLKKPEVLLAILASMQDGLSIVDPDGVHLYVNDALCRMLGFSRAELLGAKPPHPYWPPEELPTIQAAFARTLGAQVESFELIFQRKDGVRVPVIVSPAVLRDEQGTPVAFFATVKDISERKRLEHSLADSEQRWRSVAENPFDFVVLIDRQYRYTYVNHTAPGLREEDLIGRATPFDFAEPQYHEAMRAAIDLTFATGRAASYEVYVPQLNCWYSTIVGAILENGQVTQASLLTRDISGQKRVEETLRRSEQLLRETHRMETIGTLAGGMAHDINNMLTPILTAADIARLELPENHAVQQRLKTIMDAGTRARGLVQRVLLFSRRKEPIKTRFYWRQSIREDVLLLRTSLPASIKLVEQLPPEVVPICGDVTQLGQVLTNLAANALQAMRDTGGTLTICLSRDPVNTGVAHLRVQDTGPGMDKATSQRVFEPFFTTRPVGAGTGLGLSIAQSVVREHGGDINVTSEPGQGATFEVRLPTCTEPIDTIERAEPAAEPVSRRLDILLVDDEPAIAEVAQEALTLAGHSVTVFTSAQSALDWLAEGALSVDLLLTDQSMPEMKGTALIERVRVLYPALPSLIMTGLADEKTEQAAKALAVEEIVTKPFTLASLCEAVARVAAKAK